MVLPIQDSPLYPFYNYPQQKILQRWSFPPWGQSALSLFKIFFVNNSLSKFFPKVVLSTQDSPIYPYNYSSQKFSQDGPSHPGDSPLYPLQLFFANFFKGWSFPPLPPQKMSERINLDPEGITHKVTATGRTFHSKSILLQLPDRQNSAVTLQLLITAVTILNNNCDIKMEKQSKYPVQSIIICAK